jgi:molybdate transport system ATP-binding protein
MKLELQDIRASFQGFELKVDAVLCGRMTAVFGPSGAGKTTLLECITGLRRPASGRIALDGQVLFDSASGAWIPPFRRKIGYVPQDLALFPHMTVEENLRYGMAPGESISIVGDRLEITHTLDRKPLTLSGGEQRRVAFARAILTKPSMLILDEPLSNLDEPLRERIKPYLIRIRDEMKIPLLYVSHSSEEVVELCDQIVVLTGGAIAACGTPAEIFEQSTAPSYRLKSDIKK